MRFEGLKTEVKGHEIRRRYGMSGLCESSRMGGREMKVEGFRRGSVEMI